MARKTKLQRPRGSMARDAKEPPKPWQQRIAVGALDGQSTKLLNDPRFSPFAPGSIPQPPPGVLPKGVSPKVILANDSQVIQVNAWAQNSLVNSAYFNGLVFMGFPYLSELAQRPEYRAMAEVTATEMTREWVEFKSTASGTDGKAKKSDRIKELVELTKKLDLQGLFSKMAQMDSYFGRGHLYLDTGDTDDPKELVTPIGNGRDSVSATKFKGRKGFLKAVRPVEPIWCYPGRYVSNDPLKGDWYKPTTWFALGKEVHATRFLTFVSREVPDMLKPSYMFGGLPLSQMAQPYVNNWLRARQSVSDMLYRYSVDVLSTEMEASTADGGIEMMRRVDLLQQLKNNNGVMMIDKATEEWQNIAAPLSGLHELQAQAQEHQSAVSRIPLVKLLGISPAGLNASSEGEIQVWYEWVKASQENLFTDKLNTVIDLCMYSLWGETDPDIVWEWKPLKSLSAKELAEINKIEADTDAVYVGAAVVDPTEVRERLSNDPDSPYESLLPGNEPPEPAMGEEDLSDDPTLERPDDAGGRRAEGESDDRRGDDPEQATNDPRRVNGREERRSAREPRIFGDA